MPSTPPVHLPTTESTPADNVTSVSSEPKLLAAVGPTE